MKEWLFRAGQDIKVDSLSVLGNILEEFMDVQPADEEATEDWIRNRQLLVQALESDGLRYFRGGRVMPNGASSEAPAFDLSSTIEN